MSVTVTVGWTGGGNLQDTFSNDGIVARWFSLVPSDVFMLGALSVCLCLDSWSVSGFRWGFRKLQEP